MLVEKQTVGEIVKVGFQFPTNFQIGTNIETAKWINEQNKCGIRAEADAIYRAYSIGKMLLDVKKTVPEKTFLNWLDVNVEVSQRHAYNYMAIAQFPEKISGEVSLNKAVEKIGVYQRELRQIEDKKADERIAEYKETGVKPDGWRKHTDDKRMNEGKVAPPLQTSQTAPIWERLLEESDRKDSWLYKHLDALENDNARIEACHDVIKMCKRISTELQKGV